MKHRFKELSYIKVDKRVAVLAKDQEKKDYKLIATKAIVPNEKEIERNSRSKSAKLRGIERIG